MVEKLRYPLPATSEPQTINDFFRARSQDLGLTELDIAARAGLSNSTVSRVFSGQRQPGARVFLGICRVIGVKNLKEVLPYFPDTSSPSKRRISL